jgi:hypothetical protein
VFQINKRNKYKGIATMGAAAAFNPFLAEVMSIVQPPGCYIESENQRFYGGVQRNA